MGIIMDTQTQTGEASVPKPSSFISTVTADRIVEIRSRADLGDGATRLEVDELSQERAALNEWASRQPRTEHLDHAVQIVGGHLASEMAAIMLEAAEHRGAYFPTEDLQVLSDPKAHDVASGNAVVEGVRLPPPLLWRKENQDMADLLASNGLHLRQTELSDVGAQVSRMAYLAGSMTDRLDDVPARHDRTPAQQKLVAAVNFATTAVVFDGLSKSRDGFEKVGSPSVDLIRRTEGALQNIALESSRLWRNDGVPAFKGQHPKAVAAVKPAPYPSPSQMAERLSAVSKGPAVASSTDDAQLLAAAKDSVGR
jgi:hypothetical protein